LIDSAPATIGGTPGISQRVCHGYREIAHNRRQLVVDIAVPSASPGPFPGDERGPCNPAQPVTFVSALAKMVQAPPLAWRRAVAARGHIPVCVRVYAGNRPDGRGHADCDWRNATSCASRGSNMKVKFGIKQAFASSAVFGLIILVLVSVDGRVRDRFTELLAGGDAVGTWGARASSLGDVVWSVVRQHSLENAPLVVFATVGVVLFLFMVRT
jgi:hypothetical protein